MPTLCFSNDFTAKQKTILTKTFKQNCRDLGLTDFDATIQMRALPLGHPDRAGFMTRLADDCYTVVVNANCGLRDWIFTLGHEAVHVRQYRTGQLRDDLDGGGTYWGDRLVPRLYCQAQENYHKLPWEIEAHGLHDKLMESAMEVLR
jgi:hypothetical protein